MSEKLKGLFSAVILFFMVISIGVSITFLKQPDGFYFAVFFTVIGCCTQAVVLMKKTDSLKKLDL